MKRNPELSIVIPAKNEAYNLPKLFRSIRRQDYEHLATTPIFVADADSTDETPAIVARWSGELATRLVPGGLPGAGRNAGARRCRSRFILFLDADIELGDPTLIRRALGEATRRRLDLVSAHFTCPDGRAIDRLYYHACNWIVRGSKFTGPFAPGAFMLFRRRAFEALGGFDAEAQFAEDYQLSKRIPGRRFGIIPGPVIVDNERFVTWGYGRMARLFLKTMIRGRSPAYFRLDHGYWS